MLDAETLKQIAAGVATIPSEMGRAAAMIANPARAYRQVVGRPLPEDDFGGVANLQRGADRWNAGVNEALGIEDPSVLDNTGSAVARFLGGSLPSAPLRLPAALINSVPTAVRVGASVPLKAIELLTPMTFTNRTGLTRAVPIAANTTAQTVVAGAAQAALEPMDPTVPHDQYDADGNLVGTIYPEEQPGVGRVVARGITDTVRENPTASAIGAGAAGVLGVLGYRGLRTVNRAQEAARLSDTYQPFRPTDDNIPIIENTPRRWANRLAEGVQDANVQTKDALQQTMGGGGQAFDSIRAAIDQVQEPAHKARVIAALRDGVIDTPGGTIRTESMGRLAEEIAHLSRADPTLQRRFAELIIKETEADNRLHAIRMTAAGDNRMVKVDSDVPQLDPATGQQAVGMRSDGTIGPLWVQKEIAPRATLHDIDDVRLDTDIRLARQDAQLQQLADRYWKFHKDFGQAMKRFGVWNDRDLANFGRVNPHYMHTINMEGQKSPVNPRLREHKQGPPTGGDPFSAAGEYANFMLGYAYRNRMRQEVIEALRAGKQGGMPDWIGKIAHPAELRRTQVPAPGTTQGFRPMTKADVKLKGDTITYRDKGELVEVEIKNKALLNTLQTMPAHATTMLGWMRQVVQSGMTGKLATATGQPFFLANALMGAMFGPLVRSTKHPMGLLDRNVVRATSKLFGEKHAFGVRADPTAYLGMAASAVADTSAILARAVSESFRNSITYGGFLSKIPGAGAIADRAARIYTESMHARQARIGSSNASTLGDADYDMGGGNVLGDVAPHYNRMRQASPPRDFNEWRQEFARKAAPADAKVAWNIIGEIQNAVGNMAQSYLFRSNYRNVAKLEESAQKLQQQYDQAIAPAASLMQQRDGLLALARQHKAAGNNTAARPLYTQAHGVQTRIDAIYTAAEPIQARLYRENKAAYDEVNKLGVATRQILGDPGMSGAWVRDLGSSQAFPKRFVGGVIDATPYANIGIQAFAALVRAAKENPLGTATAIGLTVGVPLYLTLGNAIALDEERIANGEEPIYLPHMLNRPSWETTRYVPIYIKGVDLLETPRIRIDPQLALPWTLAYEGAIEFLKLRGDPRLDGILGYTREHIMEIANQRSWSNITTAAINAQPFSQFPPVVNAAGAAMGVEVPQFDQLIGRGGANMIPLRGLGGYDQTRLSEDIIGKRVEAVFGALLGGAGLSWVGAARSGWQSEQREPGSFTDAAVGELGGRARDRLPELQPLWDQQSRRATNDPFAEQVNAKEAAMRAIRDNISSISGAGTVGSGRYMQREQEGGGRAGVADPEMRRLLSSINQAWSTFSGPQSLPNARRVFREGMLSLEQAGLDFPTRRLRQNELAAELSRTNREQLARYVKLEHDLSRTFNRRIRLESIDPTKGIEQFERLR